MNKKSIIFDVNDQECWIFFICKTMIAKNIFGTRVISIFYFILKSIVSKKEKLLAFTWDCETTLNPVGTGDIQKR